MEFLNKRATIVMATLIDSLTGSQHRKIENGSFMPLVIEKIGQGIATPWGTGDLYSLCQFYTQNGDLMQDPEMCFFVIDSREGFTSDWNKIVIAPYMYQQASLGIYQESVRMSGNRLTVFSRKLQKDHTLFANDWMANIQTQGFLNKISNSN